MPRTALLLINSQLLPVLALDLLKLAVNSVLLVTSELVPGRLNVWEHLAELKTRRVLEHLLALADRRRRPTLTLRDNRTSLHRSEARESTGGSGTDTSKHLEKRCRVSKQAGRRRLQITEPNGKGPFGKQVRTFGRRRALLLCQHEPHGPGRPTSSCGETAKLSRRGETGLTQFP